MMGRRVITGNRPDGKSYFVADEAIETFGLWETDGELPLGASPAGTSAIVLPSTAPDIEPAPGGSRCVQVTIPPWTVMRPIFESGAIPGHDPGGFHRTATIDYIVVMGGALTLVLDEGETTLQGGDVVVQRNARHSWRNHTDAPLRFLAISIRPAGLAP